MKIHDKYLSMHIKLNEEDKQKVYIYNTKATKIAKIITATLKICFFFILLLPFTFIIFLGKGLEVIFEALSSFSIFRYDWWRLHILVLKMRRGL